MLLRIYFTVIAVAVLGPDLTRFVVVVVAAAVVVVVVPVLRFLGDFLSLSHYSGS